MKAPEEFTNWAIADALEQIKSHEDLWAAFKEGYMENAIRSMKE